MSNSKECRDHAARCIEMANEAINTKTQNALFDAAKVWLQLAQNMERGQAIRVQRVVDGAERPQ